MTSSFSNPFSRPSPFAFSSNNKESLSHSPYSYQNNRIIESQVKPGLSGMTSHFINPASTTTYTSNYMDRYNGNQRSNPFANPTLRPSLTESPLPSYDPMFSGNKQFSNSSIYQNQSNSQSYNQGPKQNPFNRPSLFSNSHNNSYSLREELSIRQTTSRKPTSEYKTDYTVPTNYDHLIYKPNSNFTQNSRNPIRSYSNQINQPNKYSPQKYNPNNYRTDNSDTASVASYINKVNDLMQDGPFRKNKQFGQSGIDQIDMFEQKPIKDYSHLQYKPSRNESVTNVPHSNGYDKSKYLYEKQKSKSNEYELGNKYNKYQLNNQQEQQYNKPYNKTNAQTHNYYHHSTSNHPNYQKLQSPKRNQHQSNSIQKNKYSNQYQNQQYLETKPNKNYQNNDYEPLKKYGSVQKYQLINKYEPVQKYGTTQNYQPILNNNNFENFDEDKQFNFDNRQSLNGDDSEPQPRFDNNFRNNLSQPENYANSKKYTHPQFGNSFKPESSQRQNDMIVRFGDDDSHYVNDYSLHNQRQPESVPTNDSKLNRDSTNDRYPSVVNLKGIQFYKVNLVNN